MYCKNCGREIDDRAVICVHCGCPVDNRIYSSNDSRKEWLLTVLLCFFFGGFGIHRFYVGKIGTGLLMLLTAGGCGIWWLVDFILVLCGNFRDNEGRYIRNN